jgi:hypothetical protein
LPKLLFSNNMDRDCILTLLDNIKTQRLIGRVDLETVSIALEQGLINHTEEGNFQVSQKGEDYISSLNYTSSRSQLS